jgi:predicted Zn-dependent peptidase
MTKKYFDPAKMTVVMVGDQKAIQEQINKAAPKKAF